MTTPTSDIKRLHTMRASTQRFRTQISNRLYAVENGGHAYSTMPDVYSELQTFLESIEDRIDKRILVELAEFPVWDYWLKHVKGIGPSLAGQMLAMLIPPIAERSPAIWFKAAGLNPVKQYDDKGNPTGETRLPRPTKPRCLECHSTSLRPSKNEGQGKVCRDCGAVMPEGYGRVTYYPTLRTCLYNVGESFVRSGGYYRQKYEHFKEALTEKHEDDWPKIRIDRVARWKTVKLFLSHLWNKWAEVEGLPVRGPYGSVILPDGNRVIRIEQPDGSFTEHAYIPPPEPDPSGKKI